MEEWEQNREYPQRGGERKRGVRVESEEGEAERVRDTDKK